MRNPRLAGVYAKSLFDFAKGANQIDDVVQDMQYIRAVVKASPEFSRLIASPIIKDDKKATVVAAVLKDKVSAATWAFLTLVIQKNRAQYLDQIARSFVELYEKSKGIHEVTMTSAIALDSNTQNIIVDKLKRVANFDQIKLITQIKPDIIGGFILEFDNKLIDASVSRKLNDLKLKFADKSYIMAV